MALLSLVLPNALQASSVLSTVLLSVVLPVVLRGGRGSIPLLRGRGSAIGILLALGGVLLRWLLRVLRVWLLRVLGVRLLSVLGVWLLSVLRGWLSVLPRVVLCQVRWGGTVLV